MDISKKGHAMRIHRFLRRKAASQYLEETWGVNCAYSTLAKYAVVGGGPTFRRAGRIPLYATNDLDEWVASKLSPPMRSTSDMASPKNKIASQSYLGEEGEGPDNGVLSKAGA
jgi:hypothetical protein